jgi:hypothetical protein
MQRHRTRQERVRYIVVVVVTFTLGVLGHVHGAITRPDTDNKFISIGITVRAPTFLLVLEQLRATLTISFIGTNMILAPSRSSK